MGHTKPENLLDISAELRAVRHLDSIEERKPGIFYLKRIPFLHFHDKDGKRWADIKTTMGWKQIDLNFKATASSRRRFLADVRRAYAVMRNRS